MEYIKSEIIRDILYYYINCARVKYEISFKLLYSRILSLNEYQ